MGSTTATLACLVLGLLAAPPAAGAPRFRKERFETGYRQALEGYARGGGAGALDRLLDLETAASGAGDDRLLEKIGRSERRVIRKLQDQDIEVLLPLALLHEGAYLAHLASGRQQLATHSRLLAAEIAEGYARGARAGGGSRWASRLLTSLGGHLHQAFHERTGARLYRRALDLDPDNRAALQGLAVVHEKFGSYAQALPLLERLGRLEPEGREWRLRLAVNLVRVGRRLEGMRALEGLVAGPGTDWPEALAHQELARLLLHDGELDSARFLLEQARARFPCDTALAIQLAYLEERTEPDADGSDLAGSLRGCTAAAATPARTRYNQTPVRLLEELRGELAAQAAARLPGLRRALAGGSRSEAPR